MAKIPVSSLLADFRRMYQEHWDYVAGGASERQVDCSGAFVWSFGQHGCKIYHGSNRIAREEVIQLVPLKEAQIVPGMAAFKSRTPGLFSGYSLPESYLQDGAHYNGDLNDYYHIGLVSEDTSKVLNAQSSKTGFVSSDISKGGWTHVAYLKQVDYGATNPVQTDTPSSGHESSTSSSPNEPEAISTAVVYAASGKTVKLRQKPSKSCNVYWDVPIGAEVMVRGAEQGGWTPIAWGGHTGYMMSVFLTEDQENGHDTTADGKNWAAEIYDLTKSEAQAIKAKYPNANIFETVG